MTSDLSSPVDRQAAILKAAAHPVRLQLIMLLRKASQGISVRQLQQQLAIDHNTVSHHLSLLRDKGIVTATPKGNERLYSLRNTRLAEAVSVLLVQ
nr:metalloregulator ArsR/SmtB family transcription factor [uncultured Arsenicibacter sp.]